MQATYNSKDQNWANESTTYWFTLDGEDRGTGVVFDNEEFGIVERGEEVSIVDSDGYPLTAGDWNYIAVSKYAIVTDEMRLEQI